jgi:hypothetical protein
MFSEYAAFLLYLTEAVKSLLWDTRFLPFKCKLNDAHKTFIDGGLCELVVIHSSPHP